MTGVIFGAIDSPFHSSDLSEDISLYPNLISSFCRADMRSVSFILRVCRPVNLNGTLLNSKLRQGFGLSRVARIGPVRIMKWFCPIFLVLCLPEKTGWKHPEVRKVRLCGHRLEGFCSRDSARISQLRVRAPAISYQ